MKRADLEHIIRASADIATNIDDERRALITAFMAADFRDNSPSRKT